MILYAISRWTKQNTVGSRARWCMSLVHPMARILYAREPHRNRGWQWRKYSSRRRWKRSRLVQSGKVLHDYLTGWRTWVKGRNTQAKGPSLRTRDYPDQAVTKPPEFMASRCFVRNNQHSTVRGYLAIIFPTRCLQVGNYRWHISSSWQREKGQTVSIARLKTQKTS